MSKEARTDIEQPQPVMLEKNNTAEQVEFVKEDLAARDYSGVTGKTDPKEIALVRKLDLYILPILWLMYFLNFTDRNAIINGRLNGLEKDLKLKGSQYNTCVSILFVGYFVGQVPSNMILTRVRPSIYMGSFMMLWAVVAALGACAKNYRDMVLVRFFLGVTEAPYYPGALYMLSTFYTKKEIATRMAIFYTGNIGANAFSGLIAAATFAGLDHKYGIRGWQWLFIITGVLTFGIALISIFILPDTPLTTRWLSEEERQLAHARILRDTTEEKGTESTWAGLKQALLDYRTWLFCLMINLHLSANGFKNFLPSVVQTLGFNTTITLVLVTPPYLFAAFTNVLVCWSSGRWNERTWHITISKIVAIVGFILSCATLNIGAKYTGMMIFTAATYGVNNIGLGWAASTLGQTPEKKAVAMALINTIGNLSSVYTPYLWPSSDAPRYAKAFSASAGFSVGVIILTFIIRWICIRDNTRIKREEPETVVLYAY